MELVIVVFNYHSMKSFFFIVFFLSPLLSYCQVTISPNDLKPLLNAAWKGQLMYTDYTTGKETFIDAAINVTQSATDSLTWYFDYQYPKEPNANSQSVIKISPNGQELNGEKVISKETLNNKTLQIVTETQGEDNDRNATIRHTYTISNLSKIEFGGIFYIKKEVLHYVEKDFFVRNEYKFTIPGLWDY